jgi:hypothetical protein
VLEADEVAAIEEVQGWAAGLGALHTRVTADEAYGGNPALRGWLEDRGLSSVLAVKCTEPLRPASQGSVRGTATQLAAQVPAEQWVACSAGHGAKGRRLYDWTRVALALPAAVNTARWLLVRRSRADGDFAFSTCFAPATTSLVGLIRVAGVRWAIEESFQTAKGEVGLGHYEVRRWPGWFRHVTLALLGPRVPDRHPRPGHCWVGTGGMRPDRLARHAPADRPRGPPPADRAHLADTRPTQPRAGLVTLATTPPGPRSTRPLPTTRTASVVGCSSVPNSHGS